MIERLSRLTGALAQLGQRLMGFGLLGRELRGPAAFQRGFQQRPRLGQSALGKVEAAQTKPAFVLYVCNAMVVGQFTGASVCSFGLLQAALPLVDQGQVAQRAGVIDRARLLQQGQGFQQCFLGFVITFQIFKINAHVIAGHRRVQQAVELTVQLIGLGVGGQPILGPAAARIHHTDTVEGPRLGLAVAVSFVHLQGAEQMCKRALEVVQPFIHDPHTANGIGTAHLIAGLLEQLPGLLIGRQRVGQLTQMEQRHALLEPAAPLQGSILQPGGQRGRLAGQRQRPMCVALVDRCTKIKPCQDLFTQSRCLHQTLLERLHLLGHEPASLRECRVQEQRGKGIPNQAAREATTARCAVGRSNARAPCFGEIHFQKPRYTTALQGRKQFAAPQRRGGAAMGVLDVKRSVARSSICRG